MKEFLKMTLASFIGVCLGLLGFTFFMFIMLGALLSMGDQPFEVKSNSVLRISLDVPIVDQQNADLSSSIDLLTLEMRPTLTLYEVLKSIEKAAEDPKIKGIYMDLSKVNVSVSAAEEVREALKEFKKSGKFILSYADNYSQVGYYFATVADNIYLNPYGTAMLQGLSSEVMFYKRTLEKLGIDMQIVRHGKFKSAVEPFTNEKMSPENREQVLAYMGSIWNYLLQEISEARNVSVDSLNILADKLTLKNAESALTHKLVDGLLYKNEVVEKLCSYVNVRGEKELSLVDLSKYVKDHVGTVRSKNKIAVIYASGEIYTGTGNSGIMSTTVSSIIRQARSDSTVKAIVFRVNSPGGDAQASEIIAHELELAGKDKTVVISMGSLAASGGYWISTPGQTIIANHTTLTGSIGVFGMIPNIQKGLSDLTGITVDAVGTNENAGGLSIYRPMNAAERDFIQYNIEDIYDKFITKVSKSRSMSKDAVDSIGQGRVWSGVNALENGLVDELGGLTRAIELAAEKAYLSDYRIVEMPKRKSALEELMNNVLNSSVMASKESNDLKRTLEKYEYIKSLVTNPGIKARMTYDVDLN